MSTKPSKWIDLLKDNMIFTFVRRGGEKKYFFFSNTTKHSNTHRNFQPGVLFAEEKKIIKIFVHKHNQTLKYLKKLPAWGFVRRGKKNNKLCELNAELSRKHQKAYERFSKNSQVFKISQKLPKIKSDILHFFKIF